MRGGNGFSAERIFEQLPCFHTREVSSRPPGHFDKSEASVAQTLAHKTIFGVGLALSLFVSLRAYATEFTVLHDFTGKGDGSFPTGGLIMDKNGNLFGTTGSGGHYRESGTVFEVEAGGEKVELFSFDNFDGRAPAASVFEDKQGNFYGTTSEGGPKKSCGGKTGCGVIFELTPNGTETVLHSFAGGGDGTYPDAPLIADRQGNFYGTTNEGGDGECDFGCGTVFKLATDGTKTIVHSFTGTDGANPFSGLIADKQGNFYGTTWSGNGNVFKLTSDGVLTVLYAFKGRSDGAAPYAGLIADDKGNLYGTTEIGGGTGCYNQMGCGTVFKLAADGTETVLHAFAGGADGSVPFAGLVADRQGNLYGTTYRGGGTGCDGDGCGTETVLHAFTGGNDGAWPYASLILDKHGNLFGTASAGNGGCGSFGCGVVFELKK
jgi:uncharacterized repeat protein (TIGR03803 family)